MKHHSPRPPWRLCSSSMRDVHAQITPLQAGNNNQNRRHSPIDVRIGAGLVPAKHAAHFHRQRLCFGNVQPRIKLADCLLGNFRWRFCAIVVGWIVTGLATFNHANSFARLAGKNTKQYLGSFSSLTVLFGFRKRCCARLTAVRPWARGGGTTGLATAPCPVFFGPARQITKPPAR